jgi:type II secretory pathway component PulF
MRQLSTLLSAGVSILRALHILAAQQENTALKNVLRQVVTQVSGGVLLSVAFGEHPTVFSPVIVSMIRLGETTGTLPHVCSELATYLENDVRMENRVRAAMVYPVFVTLFSFATLAALLHWIIPPLLDMCTTLCGSPDRLPWPTVTVMRLVEVSHNPRQLAMMAALVLVGVHALDRWRRTPSGCLLWYRFLLQLPVVGPLQQKVLVSQFCRTLGTLLASGIRMHETFLVLMETAPNPHFARHTVRPLVDGLTKGRVLHRLLKDLQFPTVVSQLAYVGEMSGKLPDRLQAAARMYDEDVRQSLDTFSQVLEPFLMATLGCVVGFIVAAVFMPLYTAMNHL